MPSTSTSRQIRVEPAPALNRAQSRHHAVRILFVHHDAGYIERCLHELKLVHFKVSTDVVLTPEQFAGRLISHPYDLVVAEYPSPNWEETQALTLLHQRSVQSGRGLNPNLATCRRRRHRSSNDSLQLFPSRRSRGSGAPPKSLRSPERQSILTCARQIGTPRRAGIFHTNNLRAKCSRK